MFSFLFKFREVNNFRPSGRGTFGKAFIGGALGAAAGLATFELGKVSYKLNSSSRKFLDRNNQNYILRVIFSLFIFRTVFLLFILDLFSFMYIFTITII